MMGWLVKAVKWLGYAFRILKRTKEVLNEEDSKKDKDCEKNHDA